MVIPVEKLMNKQKFYAEKRHECGFMKRNRTVDSSDVVRWKRTKCEGYIHNLDYLREILTTKFWLIKSRKSWRQDVLRKKYFCVARTEEADI